MEMLKAHCVNTAEEFDCLIPFEVRDRDKHTLDVWVIREDGSVQLVHVIKLTVIDVVNVKSFLDGE